jgi:hypothetical protein
MNCTAKRYRRFPTRLERLRFDALRQVGQTGLRVAKDPNINSPEYNESVSMKYP